MQNNTTRTWAWLSGCVWLFSAQVPAQSQPTIRPSIQHLSPHTLAASRVVAVGAFDPAPYAAHPDLRPPEDQLAAASHYYFEAHPDIEPPPGVVEALAEYYFVKHPELTPPTALRPVLQRRFAVRAVTLPASVALREQLVQMRVLHLDSAAHPPPSPRPASGPESHQGEPMTTAEPVPDEPEALPPPPVSVPVDQGTATPATATLPQEGRPAVAVTQLSRTELGPDEPILLKAAASFTLSEAALRALLAREFAAVDPGQDAARSAAVASELNSSQWGEFKEIGARISQCPAFLDCVGQTTRVPFSLEKMLWSWRLALKAKEQPTLSADYLTIEFFGLTTDDQADAQGVPIAAIPVVKLNFEVHCDHGCIVHAIEDGTGVLAALKKLLDEFKSVLMAAAAIVALVGGWFGWRKRGASPSSPQEAKPVA